SARAPAKSSTLSRVFAPCVTDTAEGLTPRWRARKRTRAALAWPSTGGAVRQTTRAPLRSPATSSRAARGETRTRKVAPPATSRTSIIGGSARCEREPLLGFLAPLEEAEVVLELGLLLEVEQVAQARDQGAHIGAQRAAVGAQVEDAALHLVGAALGQLDQAVGLHLRFLDRGLRLLARVVADLLGHALGGEERVLQDGLAVAVLVDEGADG